MKTFIPALCFFWAFIVAQGQISDDFSDGDFTGNPEWQGDVALFEVEEEKLKLNDVDALQNITGLSLFAPTGNRATTTWEVAVQLDFDPSSSNFAMIYLNAQSADLTTLPDGYFLKVGGISGNEDALELYVREGGMDRLIIEGSIGAVAEAPDLKVRVIRSTEGNWQLLADYAGGDNFQLEGEAIDVTFQQGNYFGVVCRYTSTRKEAFRFDDVFIDPIQEDDMPPILLEVLPENDSQLQLIYNEPVLPASLRPSNFSIDQGIGEPNTVMVDPENSSIVYLTLSNPLQSFIAYQLTTSGVQDFFGNVSPETNLNFTFIKFEVAEVNDIIISEIFPDPNPSVGLPEFEFVELFNTSNKVIQLENFGFSSGGSPKQLAPFVLEPGAYVVLTDEEALEQFEPFGTVLPIASFPSLTNSQDELTLTDPDGNIIFEIAYSSSWYQDEMRENGGYTLEIINTGGPFDCAGNWRASSNENGGTPGMVNSWEGQSPDQEGPTLLKAIARTNNEIELTFNESVDEGTVDPANFAINIGASILDAFSAGRNSDQIILMLDQDLAKGIIYEVTVNSNIKDCLGNSVLEDTKLTFGLPESTELGDVIINEVLFNPESGGEDFVELYNVSNKVLNLNGLQIVNTQKLSGNSRQAIETDFLLFPGAYVVITDQPDDIINRYTSGPVAAFLANDLPTLDAKEGNVTLSLDNVVIDVFDYSEDLHYTLLENKKGVSLERISFLSPTNDPGNWHTAAATAGFATPGLDNSQFFPSGNMIEQVLEIPVTTLSPDADGFQDFLQMRYETDQPGYVLSAKIFDVEGREVFGWLNNELLGNKGAFKWDGVTNEGSRARIGIYIVWLELFDQAGNVNREKQTIVVAGRLD